MAGLRRPGAAPGKRTEPAADHTDQQIAPVEPAPVEATDPTPTPTPVDIEEPPVEADATGPESVDTEVISEPVIGAPTPEESAAEESPDEQPARSRPSGKHRWTGRARPVDLAEAEAEVAGAEPVRTRRDTTLGWAVTLGVLAVALAVLAVIFHGKATSRSEGADVNNRALIDPATQSEVVRQLRAAVEKAFTYNYTDLDSTAKAVQENLTGKALCEYEQLYGQVKKLAPEQKLVLTTQVREIGVTRLEGDRAALLVFVDQRTTRADQNQTTASGAQFGINAERQNGTWKITNIDMLGQPLPNGQAAPQC